MRAVPGVETDVRTSGKALKTSRSVGIRKSFGWCPSSFTSPSAAPLNGYAAESSPWTALLPGTNQCAASSARSWSRVMSLTKPVPFVVSSTVLLWMTTRWPSAVDWMSSSSMSAPRATDSSKAYIVFMGNSCSPPECAMFMTRRSSHGFGEVWQDQFFLAWPRLSVLASAAPAGPAAAVSAAASVRAPALARERTRPMAVNVLSRAAPRQTREDEM